MRKWAIYNLYDFVNDPNIFQWATISSLEEWNDYVSQTGKSYKNNIYNGISDHSPTSYDLILDENDQK